MYACMYACMHVCMYVCMYVCKYVCMHVHVCKKLNVNRLKDSKMQDLLSKPGIFVIS